jgi:hypothetical protein
LKFLKLTFPGGRRTLAEQSFDRKPLQASK